MPEAETKPAIPDAQDFHHDEQPELELAPAADEGKITLRVRDQDNNEFMFMMKRSTPFKKIFDAFALKVKENVRHFRFHYDGLRLAEDDSPERMGLNDDDTIEAFVLAEGG